MKRWTRQQEHWGSRSATALTPWERGVTLVEVMIVVAILAMVAGGVAIFAIPRFRDAQLSTAKTGAQTIRQAAQTWQTTNTDNSCPTVSQLIQEKHLDPGQETVDPWGEEYMLSCTEDDIVVLSKGPDKKRGTQDDIQVPQGVTAEESEE